MISKEDILSCGWEWDDYGGGNSAKYVENCDCYILELSKENTNNNLRLPATFAYLMVHRIYDRIELELDETRVAFGFMIPDKQSLISLMNLVGIKGGYK